MSEKRRERDRPDLAAPLALEPGIQHYDWGDPTFIPELLGIENPARRPHAELWLGAHPRLPATVVFGDSTAPLDDLIRRRRAAILGAELARRESTLPFLMKVIAAARPLSIQSHPTRAQALEGFAREKARGVPISAPERSYRDDNHKPELIAAVTDFWALRGFRPLDELSRVLADIPELAAHTADFDPSPDGLRRIFERLMTLSQGEVDRALAPLVERLRAADGESPFDRDDHRYWVLAADREFSRDGHHDRGLFAVLLLNLFHLRPGQALFLDAGTLHAYLEGVGVEVMATSDNVLRCGLTSKHVDVPELLRTVRFEGEEPRVLEAEDAGGEAVYRTPAPEFELRRIALAAGAVHRRGPSRGPSILLVLEADDPVAVRSESGELSLRRGGACLVPHGVQVTLGATGRATICVASLPVRAPSGGAGVDASPPSFRGRRPSALRFGTSGLRGPVEEITDLEAYINVRGFLEHVAQLGEVSPGGRVAIGGDLRPSTARILRAVARAIDDAGLEVINTGRLPTPALASYTFSRGWPGIMVTGSHIPFDRNGIKFTRARAEVLKSDERPILAAVERARRQEYARPAAESPFDDDGMFRAGEERELPGADNAACREYVQRFVEFFTGQPLSGLRVVFHEHSAVGREVVPEILRALGAEVIAAGRSDEFVPVDTEAIDDEHRALLQGLADRARERHGRIDAVVSIDGDSDRPLVAGVDPDGTVRFVSGDRLGIVVADFLDADDIAVPVSATDAIELHFRKRRVRVTRTRIGSPHVIEAMQSGQGARRVGWEANGGFLTGSEIEREGRRLAALPTRDAVLPIAAALASASGRGVAVVELLERLPARYSTAGLIDEFPVETSRALVRRFSPVGSDSGEEVVEARFDDGVGTVTAIGPDGMSSAASGALAGELRGIRVELERYFSRTRGFQPLVAVNFLDGIRMLFAGGEIAHVRPSGNAPQLRCYAVADDERRAAEIVAVTVRHPDGILRELERRVRDAELVAAVKRTISLTGELIRSGRSPEVIGTVSGSSAAREFWQRALDVARPSLGAREAISLHEDLPVNQAFGLLLLWRRLRERLREDRGALISFVFGEGTRATPFTEAENGQKAALATFVTEPRQGTPRYLPVVELALRHFVPVQQFLRRSGFDGLVVKWGDEIQIPTRDLSGADPTLADADVIRFVSVREMTEDDARSKDWVGVDRDGKVTAFIPRRPLAEMEPLADRGLVRRRGGRLVGGINLGSIAVSRRFLDALLEEFEAEVLDPDADRRSRPDLDPQFFTALVVAAIHDEAERDAAWRDSVAGSDALRALGENMPDLLDRLRRVIEGHESRTGRATRIVAMDFGDQYWGDIGQHRKIHDFFMALNAAGPTGEIARALAGIPDERDAHGNIIVGDTTLSPDVVVRDSVLINASIRGPGRVQRSVLVGTRAGRIDAEDAFDVLGATVALTLAPRSGAYRLISDQPIEATRGERWTTLVLPDGPVAMRVDEDTDLRDRKRSYERPIHGNPISFREAHELMSAMSPEELAGRREAMVRRVEASR